MSAPITTAEIDKMLDDDYKNGALGIFGWQNSAEKLKRAADIVYQEYISRMKSRPDGTVVCEGSKDWEKHSDPNLIDVYYLLIGLSIENWVKAILVRYLPTELDTEQKLDKIRTHKTHELLNSYDNMREFKKDEDILKKLEEYVKWKGKYPVPTKREDYNHDHIAGQIDTINELYGRLYKRQKRERRLDILKSSGDWNSDRSLKDFLDNRHTIVEFYKNDPDKKISKILSAYDYSWPIVRQALEDYKEDLGEEEQRRIWLKIELFDIRGEDAYTASRSNVVND